MGNHHQHQEILQQINQLQVLIKTSHYTILKSSDGTQYIKFLYNSQKQNQQSYELSKSSIFNKNYLSFRFQQQQSEGKLHKLPKLVAFGDEVQVARIISCTSSELSYAIFQHPSKTLKKQIENRITEGTAFLESQLLSLIKNVSEGLLQYYQHMKLWHEETLSKKIFTLTEENIFVNTRGQFQVSDILQNFNQIEQISRHEVILQKSSRKSSSVKFHPKITGKMNRQTFFSINLSNLASILQSLIFKFSCFSHSHKNSLHEGGSLETASQSYRFGGKSLHRLSSQFQKLLKELRHPRVNQRLIIQTIERMSSAIHLPTPLQSFESFSKITELKNCIQNNLNKQIKNDNLNEKIFQERQPLTQITRQNQNTLTESDRKVQFNFIADKRKSQNNLLHKNNFQIQQRKSCQKSNNKIRLSLTKDSQFNRQRQSRENSVENSKKIQRKTSHPKFLCAKNNIVSIQAKSNPKISIKINPAGVQSLRQTNKSQNAEKLAQNLLKNKLVETPCRQNNLFAQEKKKLFLKKPTQNKQPCQIIEYQAKKPSDQNVQSIHLNPMSRKKTLGLNKLLAPKEKQELVIFKTIQKPNNEIDTQILQNLSSIVSNQNNTMSSCGLPMTDQFRTDNSLIEEEGGIGLKQILETQNKKTRSPDNSPKLDKDKPSDPGAALSPLFTKLQSYPSIQLVESIIQRPEEKIPEFLKQFKLPQKHLLALNNIILRQKDVIVQQSFEQSQFNSIRQSAPYGFGFEEDMNDFRNERNSRMASQGLEATFEQKRQINIQDVNVSMSQIFAQHQQGGLGFEKQGDSFERGLEFIQTSLITNRNLENRIFSH